MKPLKYRKKPVVIEAMQYHGLSNGTEVRRWAEQNGAKVRYTVDYSTFAIMTLEGEMEVAPDDFLIKGIKGEFYPCKPDIFLSSYELVQ